MSSSRFLPCLLTLLSVTVCARADWPQWRGPGGSGISDDRTPLISSLPEAGFRLAWESGEIPSDHYGGHSSPVISGDKVILSVVWHRRVPSETRLIDTEIMQKFNHRGLAPELGAKMEEARLALNPRLRGEKLEAFIETWNKENLTPEQQISLGSWVASRFKAGKTAIDLIWLDKVASKQDKPFPNAAALAEWLDEEKFPPDVRQKVLDAVPNTIQVASDTVLALDLKTGKELWKYQSEGLPTGRRSSATPAVVNGKVYAMGSTHLYCVDAVHGTLVWKAELPAKGPGSSPLVIGERVYVAAGSPAAYRADTGERLWNTKAIRTGDGSPTWWTPANTTPQLVINTSNALVALNPDDGTKLWEAEGGSQSTAVTAGDQLVIYSGQKDVGLRVYQYQAGGPPKALWSNYWLTRRYTGTPIVYQDMIFAMCGEKHLCLDLLTGKKHWEEPVNSTISSPLLADGKIFIQENNGTHLRIVKADPASYQMLARGKIAGLGCATPAIGRGHLIVRQKDKLVAFDIRSPLP